MNLTSELILKHKDQVASLLEVKAHTRRSKKGKNYQVKQFERKNRGTSIADRTAAMDKDLQAYAKEKKFRALDKQIAPTIDKTKAGRSVKIPAQRLHNADMPKFSVYQNQSEHDEAIKKELKRTTSKMSKKQKKALAYWGSYRPGFK